MNKPQNYLWANSYELKTLFRIFQRYFYLYELVQFLHQIYDKQKSVKLQKIVQSVNEAVKNKKTVQYFFWLLLKTLWITTKPKNISKKKYVNYQPSMFAELENLDKQIHLLDLLAVLICEVGEVGVYVEIENGACDRRKREERALFNIIQEDESFQEE